MTRQEGLTGSELFAGLPPAECDKIGVLGREWTIKAGALIFGQGAEADSLFVIREGRVDLTFPLVVMGEAKDVRFQSLEAGRALAWSALVPPHRLTMSARAGTDVELLTFSREDLLKLFDAEPRIGLAVMANLAGVIAARHQESQTLWVREVQRTVSETYR